MSTGSTTRPLPTLKPQSKPQTKAETAPVVTEPEEKIPVKLPQETGEMITVDIGISRLLELDPIAYTVTHAQIELTEKARSAIKRLSLTLAQKGERLSNGKICDTSVPFAIVWLCERFAESVTEMKLK